MKKFVQITGDYNDGDYDIELTEISDEDIESLKTIISKMPHTGDKLYQSIPYETREIGNDDKSDELYPHITQSDKDFLKRFLPIGESNYQGIHTITEIKIFNQLEILL